MFHSRKSEIVETPYQIHSLPEVYILDQRGSATANNKLPTLRVSWVVKSKYDFLSFTMELQDMIQEFVPLSLHHLLLRATTTIITITITTTPRS